MLHYEDVIMGAMASQITSLTIVYSTVYSGADQRKHQSSASLAFVRGIHRWPVNSPHKWPVTRKMFPFDDVIMPLLCCALLGFGYIFSGCCDVFVIFPKAALLSRIERHACEITLKYLGKINRWTATPTTKHNHVHISWHIIKLRDWVRMTLKIWEFFLISFWYIMSGTLKTIWQRTKVFEKWIQPI